MYPLNERIRLVQLDGKTPNLAMMKLSHWHKAQGDTVELATTVDPSLLEPRDYDRVYGSAIFDWTRPQVERLRQAYPGAVVGGTGCEPPDCYRTVEQLIGVEPYGYEHYDYDIYPAFRWSLGFTQRGCRMYCPFCVVPEKEGRPESVNTILDIWRPGTPRTVMLLDNDFFGQPGDEWRARIGEIKDGGFRVCFNQGINTRLVTEEAAAALASVEYRDDQFTRRRLYTAWDNLGDWRIFWRGVDKLKRAGIPAKHLMVYMLVGFADGETMDDVLTRYRALKEGGCMPYPMVYGPELTDDPDENAARVQRYQRLKAFQRWVVGRYDQVVTWDRYRGNPDRRRSD